MSSSSLLDTSTPNGSTKSAVAMLSPKHGQLSSNQERLLYLLSLYSDSFLSVPCISVMVFEGTKEPPEDDEDSENEVSISRRSGMADIMVDVDEKFAFTYHFFQSFGDILPGVQIQLFSSMVLKNDLRFFKKRGVMVEEKIDGDTGKENCYKISEAGWEAVREVSEKCKQSVHNLVYAPGTTELLTVSVRDKAFFVHTANKSFEKKSRITLPQERAEALAAARSEAGEDEGDNENRSFHLSKVQQSLSIHEQEAGEAIKEEGNESKACCVQ